MKGYLFLNQLELGEINFKVIDEGMGVIGGNLKPSQNYYEHQKNIQMSYDRKGIANSNDFDFSVRIDEFGVLTAEGGIGVTDMKGFNEIYIEVSGLNHEIIQQVLNSE